jgi:uncharacterized membrane protein YeaQ/YmgE (transglycosylase-associated protein family)
MSKKFLITAGMVVGGTLGQYVPALWGNTSSLSFAAILFSLIGGLLGIWVGFRAGQYLEA